ncbi:3-oxoadipate enol-lactonase [Nocardioides lentus]|uniref:3-oxoadipate enol-lactonase n=1 Tax=Nocardioides lentus TaxID=338077 RepID=A0ABN2NWB4_9ACTN
MRPLLLLHPLGSAGSFWDDLAAGWTGGPVVAPDLPGHGSAPLPDPDAGVAGIAEHVLSALDAAGTGPVDVVGVSLGGLVAQHLAAHAAHRVARVVLVDTVDVYPAPMREMWAERAHLARTEGMAPLVEPTLEVWFTPGFRAERPDVVAATTDTLLATDPEGYARACELLAGADLTAGPTAGGDPVAPPTLVVCGDGDGEPFRRAAADRLGPASGRDVVWLPGRHAVVLEQPAAFADLLRRFLIDPAATPR